MFTSILTTNIRETISQAYKYDDQLINKWLNVSGSGIENCIDDQYNLLKDQPTLNFYKVEENDEFVGYFGEESNGQWMSTIFIMPNYRPRKKEFWKQVESKMRSTWQCGGYVKNIPACRFYLKFGKPVKYLETPKGLTIHFEFKRTE